jgi:hypothetical protein
MRSHVPCMYQQVPADSEYPASRVMDCTTRLTQVADQSVTGSAIKIAFNTREVGGGVHLSLFTLSIHAEGTAGPAGAYTTSLPLAGSVLQHLLASWPQYYTQHQDYMTMCSHQSVHAACSHLCDLQGLQGVPLACTRFVYPVPCLAAASPDCPAYCQTQ